MTPFRAAILFLWVAVFFTGSGGAQPQGLVVPTGSASNPNPVTGSPYSAVEETQRTQTLPDGTHVVSKGQARLYRDSAGRTRRENFALIDGKLLGNGPLVVIVTDPIAHVTYTLAPRLHRAERTTEQLQESLKSSTPPSPRAAPAVPKVTREDLGTQTMEGLLAKGDRTTRTIPAGSEGNDGPIVVVDEEWTSVELNLGMLSKESDPRYGEFVTRVTSLDRSEPDPALFQVPADYTVKDFDPTLFKASADHTVKDPGAK